MIPVFIALGSNLPPKEIPCGHAGDPAFNLMIAINHMTVFCKILKQSTVITTKAQYVENQPDFSNQVILVETDLLAQDLLKQLKAVEMKMGRELTVPNGPRLIDLDILYYGSLILLESDLVIPHPRIGERAFVLSPLLEIAPDFVCPQRGMTIQDQWRSFIKNNDGY